MADAAPRLDADALTGPGDGPDGGARPFLASIEILVAGHRFRLGEHGGPDFGAAPLAPTRTLESQAMRWSYVLRARERWLDKGAAPKDHEDAAAVTLREFGLDDDAFRRIAQASRVVIRMPYEAESQGWAGRIFPWEYVIAAATRQLRRSEGAAITVMRELRGASRRTWRPRAAGPRLLYVQSAPAGLRRTWQFDDELRRLRRSMWTLDVEVLSDPTLRQLQAKVQAFKPDLIHLSGFDNLGALRALHDLAGPAEPVEADGGQLIEVAELLSHERTVPDGMLLAGEGSGAAVVSAQRLSAALASGTGHCAYFVGVSLENSAARTAALLVGERAALSAVGFQDAIDPSLINYFFELVYSQLSKADKWDLPLAFEQAWLRIRTEPNATRATGVALWAGADLLPPADSRQVARPAEVPRVDVPPQLICEPERELNYAVLHNNGRVFQQLVVERGGARETDWLDVDVQLHLGAEQARYQRRFRADKARVDLTDDAHLPLTASLMRSLQEAVNSSLVVQLSHQDVPLFRNTFRLRLLPVDQWRDNETDGQWLPSFVLPRDPAVMKTVEQAQRYVRVLRDNPSAGFEGYQAAASTHEEQLAEVDLQVQALWATLLHDAQLGYINPPPSYSSQLDSQRLRTPSAVMANRAGTCIDLALMFAACLELIDIYPVIFLLDGHALPGYWRHHSFQRDYQALRTPAATAGPDGDPNSSGRRQAHSWQAPGRTAFREIRELIRARQLVPLETVRLTEHCGFVEAIEAGIAALSDVEDFHSVLDIVSAREDHITPLPIMGEAP